MCSLVNNVGLIEPSKPMENVKIETFMINLSKYLIILIFLWLNKLQYYGETATYNNLLENLKYACRFNNTEITWILKVTLLKDILVVLKNQALNDCIFKNLMSPIVLETQAVTTIMHVITILMKEIDTLMHVITSWSRKFPL